MRQFLVVLFLLLPAAAAAQTTDQTGSPLEALGRFLKQGAAAEPAAEAPADGTPSPEAAGDGSGGAGVPLVHASEPEGIAAILRSEGLEARLGADSCGDPKSESASQGVSWVVYFFECEANANCRSIQFAAAFDVEPGLPPESVAEWNRAHRYGKVYLDEEGDPFFEMDVNLDGGVAEANFRDNLYLWNDVLGAFLQHIGW